jgi:hypothetical protein
MSPIMAVRGLQTTLLNAAAANTTGEWVALPEYAGVGRPRNFSWEINVTGALASMQVDLEGTDDPSTGITNVIDTVNVVADARRDVVDKSPRFVRAKLSNVGAGGGNVTVKLAT